MGNNCISSEYLFVIFISNFSVINFIFLKNMDKTIDLIIEILLRSNNTIDVIKTNIYTQNITRLTVSLKMANYADKMKSYDKEFIIACLLHNIGHQLSGEILTYRDEGTSSSDVPSSKMSSSDVPSSKMSSSDVPSSKMSSSDDKDILDLGIKDFERIGSDFLRKLDFPNKICNIIEKQTLIKRYLHYNKNYKLYDNILGINQPLNENEIRDIENDKYFYDLILFNRCEENCMDINIHGSYDQNIEKFVSYIRDVLRIDNIDY